MKFDTSESVLGWVSSNRLYESHLFFYILILLFWGAVGYFTLGFELAGYSQQVNLLCNFLWLLVLGAAMSCAPLWCRLLFGRILKQRQTEVEAEIQTRLARLHPGERDNAYTVLKGIYARQGRLTLGRPQIWSLIFIGWIMLFELFFISAWVKDLQLVWQPGWAEAAIDWVRHHTNTPPLHIDRDFFWMTFKTTNIPFDLRGGSEQEFMHSPFGQVVLFVFFIRFILFLPMTIAVGIIFWKPLDWFGIQSIDPRYIHTFKRFIWISFLSIFTTLMILSAGIFIVDVDYRATDILSKPHWLSGLWLHIFQIFILACIKILVGWFIFWKQLLVPMFIKLRMK